MASSNDSGPGKRKRSLQSVDTCGSTSDDGNNSGDEFSSKRRKKSHSRVEKRRRDRLSTLIADLNGTLLSLPKDKLDKLTVIRKARDAITYVRQLIDGSNDSTCDKAMFIQEGEVQALLRQSVEGATVHIDVSDMRTLLMSKDAAQLLGQPIDKIMAKNFLDLVHCDDRDKVEGHLTAPAKQLLVDGAREELVRTSDTEGDLLPFRCPINLQKSFFCYLDKPFLDGRLQGLLGEEMLMASDLFKIDGFFRGRFDDRTSKGSLTVEKCTGCDYYGVITPVEQPFNKKKLLDTVFPCDDDGAMARIDLNGDITQFNPKTWKKSLSIEDNALVGVSFWSLWCQEDEAHIRKTWENSSRTHRKTEARGRMWSPLGFRWTVCQFIPMHNPWGDKMEYSVVQCMPDPTAGVQPAEERPALSPKELANVLRDISASSGMVAPTPMPSSHLDASDYAPMYAEAAASNRAAQQQAAYAISGQIPSLAGYFGDGSMSPMLPPSHTPMYDPSTKHLSTTMQQLHALQAHSNQVAASAHGKLMAMQHIQYGTMPPLYQQPPM